MVTMRRLGAIGLASVLLGAFTGLAHSQTPAQPKVQPGPREPDWADLLARRYGLALFGDLLNPVETTALAVPGLFRKAGPDLVTFTPVIALGLESTTRGGWYADGPDSREPKLVELWSYRFKNSARDLETGSNLPPPLLKDSVTTFDPGDAPFGLWVSNDNFQDGGVFTEPRRVAARNERLAS